MFVITFFCSIKRNFFLQIPLYYVNIMNNVNVLNKRIYATK